MTLVEPDRTDRQTPGAPFRLYPARVVRRRRLSPGFMRVTFAGDALHRFADPGLDQRIKVILPAADGTLDLPLANDWFTNWRGMPEGRRPVIRTYTTRAVRPGEVDVDFVLHEPCGPAGRFAADGDPGDEVLLVGPATDATSSTGGIDFRLPAHARRVLVAGDETALPAITRILESLPADVGGSVLVEVPHPEDGALLPTHPTAEVRALVRGSASVGTLLLPAVREAVERGFGDGAHAEPEDVDVDHGLLWEVPGDGAIEAVDAPCYAWLAGEAGVIKALRRMLVAEVGMDRRTVAFLGYWRLGRSEND